MLFLVFGVSILRTEVNGVERILCLCVMSPPVGLINKDIIINETNAVVNNQYPVVNKTIGKAK